ncbi:pectate lyase family protein [Ochrovirga pacifica]|uniref:iota-carrageenase n=1 Tax=Ochrovirga pacifica TaxID=1042376 RepID=UPI0002559238|nr:iota-carrageenase [Ochrovirga pacifica]
MRTIGLLLFSTCIFLACSKNSVETSEPEEKAQQEQTTTNESERVFVESDFYKAPSTYAVIKNLVEDYGVDNSFDTDDSDLLQIAVNDIHSLGGGRLIIPEGNYSFAEVKLKSNVHIVISHKAVLRPSLRGDTRNFKIFSIGRHNDKVENISIVSDSETEKFMVDLRFGDNRNVAVFSFGYTENFLISGVHILDKLTVFSSFTFGISEFNSDWKFSKNGVIKNAVTEGAHYGYGLVQAQALQNVLFKKIDGEGGVTLRLETGEKQMNNLQIGGVFDIYGDQISCTSGNAAAMISPHAMHCGKVYLQNIYSKSSGFAVRIGDGFVSKKYTTPGLINGTFESVELRNVHADFGNKAQLKSKHYKYMPCELRGQISTIPIDQEGTSFYGPSVAGVLNTANYPVVFNQKAMIANGFVAGYEYVDDSEAIENCEQK